jgi:hypothetical protein
VTTAFVKWNQTTRLSRCLSCVDATLAAAIVARYGDASGLRSTPDVKAEVAEELRAKVARLANWTNESPLV